MIQVKLYLYNSAQEENGYRGTDLSAYVLSGAQNTENLTEELDVSEITLEGYHSKQEFAPETKFIIDIYDGGTLKFSLHRIVEEDVVEKPILSDDEYYRHTISLTEPSAIAQKRIVDDIAISYKLKDVTLEKVPAFDPSRTIFLTRSVTPPYQISDGFGNYVHSSEDNALQGGIERAVAFGKYFKWRTASLADSAPIYVLYTDNSDQEVRVRDYYLNLNNIKTINNSQKIQLELPIPSIMWGKPDMETTPFPFEMKGYEFIGYASFICEVVETRPNGEETIVLSQRFISSSALNGNASAPTDFPYANFVSSYNYQNFPDEYLPEYLECTTTKVGDREGIDANFYFAKYTDRTSQDAVDFSNPANKPITDEFEVKKDCSYSISLRVLNLQNGTSLGDKINTANQFDARALFTGFSSNNLRGYSKAYYIIKYFLFDAVRTSSATNYQTPYDDLPVYDFNATSGFYCYSSSSETIMITSAIPYTALNLVKKAIANSYCYKKIDGVASDDFSADSPYPFYISGKSGENVVSESELSATKINEAFYHQKNLWEILLDAGKYCHSIPQIEFGENDRFAISFYKLGTTNKKEDKATKTSVLNFRKIDDYVSACSSYVDNLVQLGGKIQEIVAPKTNSEDYTITNDSASIIVSKPIIELLNVSAITTKQITISYKSKDNISHSSSFQEGYKFDITPYIYEKSVYNLLSVKYDEKPNKGIALYYELGEKSILGGDYQLPQAVTNPYTDFAFKKILACAMMGTYPADLKRSGFDPNTHSPWYDIMIWDFLFEVTYRTKDTARIENTRPDLRHYLLSSNKDDFPQHRQFNNQQDVLVDSEAFGSNMFGKLIRTGNSNYKITDWCESLDDLKHKGELYIINGQWYYVAKVTNIFFPEHIESIVEYSKDYNQLSSIIGIPSEPRFYEISERSMIDREVQITDYMLVTTDINKLQDQDIQYPNRGRFSYYIRRIIGGGASYIKWAWTTFKGDSDIIDESTFGDKEFTKTVINPVNSYLCGNTLTFEWDMDDNFSAGTSTSEIDPESITTADGAYSVMRAVQYCDKFGKAALFDVRLSQNPPVFYPNGYDQGYVYNSNSAKEVRVLPESEITFAGDEEPTPILPLNNTSDISLSDMILLKDSREAIHLNYNLMAITDSDKFILSPFLFEEKKSTNLRFAYLSEEVNKFTNGYVEKGKIIGNASVIGYTNTAADIFGYQPDLSPMSPIPPNTKAIALCIDYNPNADNVKFLIAKNDTDTSMWYFGAPNKDAIWNAQNKNKQ